MPETEAAAPAVETPVADALAGSPPADAPAEGQAPGAPAEGQPAAPAKPGQPDPAVLELARKLAQDANLPEHQALRVEKRKLNEQRKAFDAQRGTLEQRVNAMQAELDEAQRNPFAWAAKKRGVAESEVYNERTKRAIDPHAAELDSVKTELEKFKEEQKRQTEEQRIRAEQAYQAQIERNFASEVVHIATNDKEFRLIQLGLEEGEYQPQNVAAEVLRRVRLAYDQAEQDEPGSGTILDSKEVLKTIEKELREEAKRKAARLAKLETAGQPATPDREGAVEPATHEANRSPGPRTLTNALASQTSGQKRKLTHRERMIEAEKRLRGA